MTDPQESLPSPAVTILTGDPVIAVIAEQALVTDGLNTLASWLDERDPGWRVDDDAAEHRPVDVALMPTGRYQAAGPGAFRRLTDNERLCELAGRKCYNSFGKHGSGKHNQEYIAHTQNGKFPHASIMYHAKMTFFFAGISRRMTHELIRHYVGADRIEEGCPSQESTRYTLHPGRFVLPPRYKGDAYLSDAFERAVSSAYTGYRSLVTEECYEYADAHDGAQPVGLARKRIFEAAAGLLPQQTETSLIWTTNPVALAKLCDERTDTAADLEFARFAAKLKAIAKERWPNLFPQWQEGAK